MSPSGDGANDLPEQYELLERQVQAINRFPDQNPNPVLRISDDGHLTYANTSSEPVRRALGAQVGDAIAPAYLERLRAAALNPGERVEVVDGIRTYALLPVLVPDFGFTNVYGTDITAEKVVAKFPGQNPNPVLRMRSDGELIYVNDASEPIVAALGLRVGQLLPVELRDRLLASLAHGTLTPIECPAGELVFELLPVLIAEFDFINIYGTDVTAARQVAKAKEETERLLLNILPPPIADRLRINEGVIADRFDDATLLIADIVGFTQISSELAAEELVALLNEIFSVLDVLVDRHGLEKIKTIGDAYMVIGGVPVASDDHAERTADMALEMAAAIEELQPRLAHPVRCRIGMSCGSVVAGVIGTKRTIYDVWGDTVNVCSRMEALSAPGRILASLAVYARLRDKFEFEEHGTIEVKGKGPMPTYFLTGRS
ncbi:MAG: adenylate/guanylate cyclase domain-containing protein [Candidatus Limnocylindrales bacterium]